MTANEFLLRAIIENPDADLPRLVYADWLEERGDPRGAFIRVQCQIATIAPGDSRIDELKAREQELLSKHGETWVQELGIGTELELNAFRRGFIEEVHTTAHTLLSVGKTCFQLTPLRHLTVQGYQGNILGKGGAQTITSWIGLSGLLSLRMPENNVGDEGVTAFAACPYLAKLRVLDIGNNRVSDQGAVALASSPSLQELTELYLDYNDIGVVGATALARSLILSKLTLLDFTHNFFGAEEGEEEAMDALEARFGSIVEF